MESMPLALGLFALTYILMLCLPKYRRFVALGSAVVFLATGMLPLGDAFGYIDWNVLMMIAGTMGIVSLFIESRMPARMADVLLSHVPNVKWAVVMLALFAGVISAFVDNVATVLMVAPVAMAISKRLNINPVPMIIAIAVSSNLQGAATLVGDTTAILLGGYANMNFLDFFFYLGKPSIFFAVELGALCAAAILLVMFRKETAPVPEPRVTQVTNYVPTILLLGTIVLLILASFLPGMPKTINGIICMSLLAIGLLYTVVTQKSMQPVTQALKEIDLDTILLLLGLFLVIGGITEQGVIDQLASLIHRQAGREQPLCDLYGHCVGQRALLRVHRQHSLCGHHAACGAEDRAGHGGGSHGVVFRPPVRRHPGRQPDAHRRFCQHHRHRHSAQGRV